MAGRLVIYTAVLFVAWNFNLGGLPDGPYWNRHEPRTGYIGSESHLVLQRLAQPDLHSAHPLLDHDALGNPKPYRSQFGLTGVLLVHLHPWTGLDLTTFAYVAASAFALLAAFIAAGVFAVAQCALGAPTGDVGCCLFAFAPVMLPFAPSLYWATFLMLAPFAVVWCWLPFATTPRRRVFLLTAVGSLAMARALCGYEYITSVVLAPLAAAWFHHHCAGVPWRTRLLESAAVVAVGLVGFAAALALHAAQIQEVFGVDGIAVIRERAAARTAGDQNVEIPPEVRLGSVARYFWAYFDQRALALPAVVGGGAVPLRWLAWAAIGFAAAAAIGCRRLPREAAALAGATLLALAASTSWQVLAINHMCVHQHLNLIVFAIPFLPVAAVAIGYATKTVVSRLPVRSYVGPAVLFGTGILFAINTGLATRDRRAERSNQDLATATVIVDSGKSTLRELQGAVDLVRRAGDTPPALLLEYGQLDAATGRARDPDSLMIQGWAVGDWKRMARPTARIVVTVGDRVVNAEVLRFDRPDLAIRGRPLAGAGFIAVIPSDALKSGGTVQVFAIAEGDAMSSKALNLPGER